MNEKQIIFTMKTNQTTHSTPLNKNMPKTENRWRKNQKKIWCYKIENNEWLLNDESFCTDSLNYYQIFRKYQSIWKLCKEDYTMLNAIIVK